MKRYLKCQGIAGEDVEITSIDGNFKAQLTSYHDFNMIYNKNSSSSIGGRWIVDLSINAQKNFINEKENACSCAGIVL